VRDRSPKFFAQEGKLDLGSRSRKNSSRSDRDGIVLSVRFTVGEQSPDYTPLGSRATGRLRRCVMVTYFIYASRNKLAINDLTHALEGSPVGPVVTVPGSGRHTGAHGASPR
jgi:hypothetical protein